MPAKADMIPTSMCVCVAGTSGGGAVGIGTADSGTYVFSRSQRPIIGIHENRNC